MSRFVVLTLSLAACRLFGDEPPPPPAPVAAMPAPVPKPAISLVDSHVEAVLPPTPAAPSGPFGGGAVPAVGGKSWALPGTSVPSADELAILEKLANGDESAEILKAALAIVSGAESAEARAKAATLFDAKLALVRPAVEAAKDVHAKGEALLRALHAKVLREYAHDQTYPLAALETGAFNCVSSAIVYDAFAAALGLKTLGATAPSHAFSYVVDGDRRYEVQTTGENGFDPKMSKEEYRKFLVERKLEAALQEPPKAVSNAQLFALALENRLSMHHDEGAPKSESLLRAQLATEIRTAALAPSNENYRRNVVAAWQQLADALDEAGRGSEAFTANAEAHRATAFVHDEPTVASSRTNVVAYAQHWLQDSLSPASPTLAAAVRAEAQKLLGCPGPAECAELDRAVRSAVFEAAKKRADAGAQAEAWKLVEALVARVPVGEDAGNVVYFATAEGDRRWAAEGAAPTEAWAAALLAKLECQGENLKSCGDFAGWVSGKYFDSDEAKARAWAKRAFELDGADETNRKNYAATTHNAINKLTDEHACAQAKAMLDELLAAGLDDPASKPVVADCR